MSQVPSDQWCWWCWCKCQHAPPKKRSFMQAGAYSRSGRIVTDSVSGWTFAISILDITRDDQLVNFHMLGRFGCGISFWFTLSEHYCRGLCIYLFGVFEDVVCLKAWLFRPKMARVWVRFWLTIGLQRATWYNMLGAKHDSILVLQTDSYLWPRPVRVTVNITLTNLGSSAWLGDLSLVRFKKSPERDCIVCRCCCCCCSCCCCCIDGPLGSHLASYLVGNWDGAGYIYI